MLWIILIGIVILVVSSNRFKSKKLELNKKDLVLFNKYKGMMKGKLIPKRPDNLTEWQKHIWIMASEEKSIEGEKKMYKCFAYAFVIIFILAFVLTIAT